MALNRNIELTTEEQEELAKNSPNLLKAIEKGNPAASAGLAFWRRRRSMAEEAREQAEEIQRQVTSAIEAAEPEQGSLGKWCGFPTDMTRCSPFFPLNVKELGERRFLRNYLITSANWGEILYTGPQLSIYEEDALLALLICIENNIYTREISYFLDYSTGPGEVDVLDDPKPEWVTFPDENETLPKTLTYKGAVLPILKILHGNRLPSKKDYKRLIDSLELLTVASIKLSISVKKYCKKPITQMSAMLAGVKWDDEKKELTATINPFFYETYLAGRVTLIDLAKRMRLKGLNAKALYRFVQSHRKNPVFVGHFLTLADVLNMDKEQPAWKIRQLLKVAIEELIRQEILMEKSGFVDTDIIKLERGWNAFPRKARAKNLRALR